MDYYSQKDDAIVGTLDYFENMLNKGVSKIVLYEMKRDYGGEMWCNESDFAVEEGDCGYDCPLYSPCNYIKGRCRHLVNCFIGTGKEFILTKEGLKETMKKPFVRMCINCANGKSYIEGTEYGRRCKRSNDRKIGDTTTIPEWCPGWREEY